MNAAFDFAQLAGPMENDYVRQWKDDGRPVVAYFCTHAPEELFWAAGALPLRMRATGSNDTAEADRFLSSVNCSFVRHALNRILSGDGAFLDGVLVTNSCDHIRRLHDIFTTKNSLPHSFYLDIPHLRGDDALARLVKQLRGLTAQLEQAFDTAVTDDRLAEAIFLHNRTRRLLARADALRSARPARLAGSEMLAMAVAAASMPKDLFNDLLEDRLEALEAAPTPAENGSPRLMVVGGVLDDPQYLALFESLGASIVADTLCCCSKSFSTLVDESGDPIEAIARRMLDHLPCPRMLADYETRLADVRRSVEQHDIAGVVCQRLKFCDLWGGEIQMLTHSLHEDPGIPTLVLEREYLSRSGVGQTRTRVQAFLESIG